MRRRAAVFGRERPGEFLSEVRGGTQHGNVARLAQSGGNVTMARSLIQRIGQN
jgi:hypothetical protein